MSLHFHTIHNALAPLTLPIAGIVLAQAQTTGLPDPHSWISVGWVMAAAAILVGGANQLVDLWNKLFPKPVTPPTYLTQEMFNVHLAQQKEQNGAIMTELKEMKAELKDEIKDCVTTNAEARKEIIRETKDELRKLSGRLPRV